MTQFEAQLVAFQDQIDTWGDLKTSDQAVVDNTDSTEEDVAAYTDRVAADDAAIAALTDFQAWMDTNVVTAWTDFNVAADEAAAAQANAAQEEAAATEDDTTTEDESNNTTSNSNIVA